MESPSQTLNTRYTLRDKLGAGGMGTVFRAYDRLKQEAVALKQVDVIGDDLDFRRRLTQEFRFLASLRHPHIIDVLDYGFDHERKPFYTMALLDGAQTILDAGQQTPTPQRIRYVVQLLQALHYLHQLGIIHRDVKPGNILVTQGQLRILDFGLAIELQRKPEIEESISGTPAYIAPELLLGTAPSAASDLYAVGVLLYELLVGKHPFNTQDINQLMYDVMHTEPDTTQLVASWQQLHGDTVPAADSKLDTQESAMIARVVRRLLDKSPEKRYQNAAEVIRDLSQTLGEPLPVETPLIRESFLQASRFIGREDLLKQLQGGLEGITNRNGSLWFIGGETGVGKTRLMDELVIQAMVEGVTVLRGSAREQSQPYDLWQQPIEYLLLNEAVMPIDAHNLRGILSQSANETGENQNKLIRDSLLQTLQRLDEPTLILLDDGQWAGSESADLLQHIARVIHTTPVMVVVGYRSDWGQIALDDAPCDEAKHIQLRRLNNDEMAQLCAVMLGADVQPPLVDFLQSQTEGNIFFLIEIVRLLAEKAGELTQIARLDALPESISTGGIQQTIQRRLAQVPRRFMPLLQVAAVIGRQVDVNILCEIEKRSFVDDWLTGCANASVLVRVGEGWAFAHDKLREGTTKPLGEAQKHQMYTRAARATEAVYADSVDWASTLAHLWHHSDDIHKEYDYLVRSADHTFGLGINPEAHRQLQRVLELARTLEKPLLEHVRLQNQLGIVEARMGKLQDASERLSTVLEWLEDDPASYWYARTQGNLGSTLKSSGDYAQARTHLEAAISKLETQNRLDEHADFIVQLGHLCADAGDFEEASQHLERAEALAKRVADRSSEARALNAHARLHANAGDFEAAVAALETSLAIHQAMGDRDAEASVRANLGILCGMRGQLDKAQDHLRTSGELYRQIGARRGESQAINNLGMVSLERHEYADALKHFERAHTLQTAIGDRAGVANTHTNMGHAARSLNDTPAVARHYQTALQEASQMQIMPIVLETLAGIALFCDDLQLSAMSQNLAHFIREHPASGAQIKAMIKVIPLPEASPPEKDLDAWRVELDALLGQFIP